MDSEPEWQRFRQWLHCICVVTFDLEIGQALEAVYPPHMELTEQERLNICYLAFPDSNSGCMGDTKFHVRLRVAPAREYTSLCEEQRTFNKQCLPAVRADAGHYWGFVHFRQIKDQSLKRGYFQKSLVLLTRLPLVNLFNEVCSLAAGAYFDHGEKVLARVCSDVCRWPALQAGEQTAIHLLGTCIRFVIPSWNSKVRDDSPTDQEHPEQFDSGPIPTKTLASVYEIDIFNSIYCVLSHLHLLWELVLTGEPIVVIGASPTDCSHMVQSLTSLIAPLVYASASRPYFTIHDSEFKEFTQRQAGPPSIILGVTNPFFAKTLQHWPHIIRLSGSGGCGQPKFELSKVGKSGRLSDTSPGVYTGYKPFLSRDKGLIKKVLLGVKMRRPGAVQSALLRRHLLELTQSFMIPLERYMASLMPLQKDISPFRAPPVPAEFRQEDFLARLEEAGPHLTSACRGDWAGLYRRFFRSANFKAWYETRHFELMQTLQVYQLQALSEADLRAWVEDKQEVEVVDMILKLRGKLRIFDEDSETLTSTASTVLKKETRDNLLKQLEAIKATLPDDLKSIIK